MPAPLVSITSPSAATPGIVNAGGELLNAKGNWTRPPNTSAEIRVIGMIVDDGVAPPVRPPPGLAKSDNIQYTTPNSGTWSYDKWPCGPPGEHYKLVVWLDVEDCTCYHPAKPVVFLAQ